MEPFQDQNTILPVLCKLRAAFAIAGPLSIAGKSQNSIKVYMRVVKDILSEDKREYFSKKKIKLLEDKVAQTLDSGDIDENARMIREGLEGIYDDVIDQHCGLDGVNFHPSDEMISRAIELCRPLVKCGRYSDSARIYKKVVKELLNDTTLTDHSLSQLQESIDFSDGCNDPSEVNSKFRKAVDYVYDEIRLPEIYADLPTLKDYGNNGTGPRVMLFGKANFGTGLGFNHMSLTDAIIGGKSTMELVDSSNESELGLLQGSVKDEDDKGFASVRLIPSDDYTFKERIRNARGILISLRSMCKVALRPKLQLQSEKNTRAFNWQCGFLLPAEEETEVFLPLRHFWPSIFGHALPNNGNVQLDKVDSIGFLISKVEENGSCNPNFSGCDFSVAVNWIAAVKDQNDV
ncbi:uncharacterized protein LOC135684485 [Rhopilema esculentum]|uniref:uncharacterized protein LOC135684485 n=1 Tax=Rhopilema esculentum TaxID=499914 RepID=UPI0031D6D738|eukprot:gene16856-8331_t